MRVTLVFTILALLVACAATSTSESTGEYLDSAAITTKVKAKLVDVLGTSGFAIKVKTFKDEVQLSGFVDNPVIKARAGKIAANVADVRLVRNNIVVKSTIH
ncbi:MAG: BON domain-containing protein [Legionellaceae bacterium]|nr:BON domain-containing protein [Legionellaceae bacterium]